MKNIKHLIISLILVSLLGCQISNKENKILTDKEWREVLNSTLSFGGGVDSYIYRNYNNTYMRDTIYAVYNYCEYLGYEVNDSILDIISNRGNNPITNNLDTMYNLSFTIDTINNNYITYSEPFFVNDEMILVSLYSFTLGRDTSKVFVFFLSRQNGKFEVLEYYDVRRNLIYENVPVTRITDI